MPQKAPSDKKVKKYIFSVRKDKLSNTFQRYHHSRVISAFLQ